METLLAWTLVAAIVLSAAGVVAFESPRRSATSLLSTGGFSGLLLLAEGVGQAGAAIFWLIATASMGLLLCSLLLNLRDDEHGKRRLSVRRTLASGVIAYFGAVMAGMILGSPDGQTSSTVIDDPLFVTALAEALFRDGVVPLVLIALAFLALIPSGLLLARRQAS